MAAKSVGPQSEIQTLDAVFGFTGDGFLAAAAFLTQPGSPGGDDGLRLICDLGGTGPGLIVNSYLNWDRCSMQDIALKSSVTIPTHE